ncbi:hypothetical protein evm_014510 [Chilo suppressalis]|nr:hypothetical protein evm_014510 [Chilo suppressalis]
MDYGLNVYYVYGMYEKDLANTQRKPSIYYQIVKEMYPLEEGESPEIYQDETHLDTSAFYRQFSQNYCDVRALNSCFPYQNEYLGNSGRLVITPLTDRCYLTLMCAMHLKFGGAPAGPAGTGKTETTKDLAKALAVQCVVFNCSDQLDYMAMGKFFKGLAASGAWACFDEFNRIDIEVLSVVAQQVVTIQKAQVARLDKFMFEGCELPLKASCSVFITMNPGYAGRTELPDNLKALFRPIAMMVPNYTLIAEISLFSYGFYEGKILAGKITTTFRLSSEQLSAQDHYDFGMRAVKTVILVAGNLIRQMPDADERQIVLRALRDVNVPKFLADDLILFNDTKQNQVRRSRLQVEIPQESSHGFDYHRFLSLMVSDHRRPWTLATPGVSQMRCRPLRKEYALFLKVLGSYWTDGILSSLVRGGIAVEDLDKRWYIFDGPVDAVWIENMNTVLDDNKKLCLSSGEIMKLTDRQRMIFEVADLAVASPATVSRCGMVYLDAKVVGLPPLVNAWLKSNIPPELDGADGYGIRTFFFMLYGAYEQTAHLMVSDHRRPWTLATAGVSQMRCRPLRKEYALFLKVLGSYWSGNTAGDNIFHSFVIGDALRKILPNLINIYLYPALELLRSKLHEIVISIDSALVLKFLELLDYRLRPLTGKDDRPPPGAPFIAMLPRLAPCWVVWAVTWSVGATCDHNGRAMFSDFMRSVMDENNFKPAFPKEGRVYDYTLHDGGFTDPTEDGEPANPYWYNWMANLEEYEVDPEWQFADIEVPTLDNVRSAALLGYKITNYNHVICVGPTGTGKTVTITSKLSRGLHKKFICEFIVFSARTSANQIQVKGSFNLCVS